MIHQVSLADCLEKSAPPEKVLNISALDDTVFVRICTVQQDAHTEKHAEVADISVSLPALLEAVALLAGDAEREHLRPVDHTGQSSETRLAGRRLTVTPAGQHSAVGALTDHLRYTPPPRPEGSGEKPGDKP